MAHRFIAGLRPPSSGAGSALLLSIVLITALAAILAWPYHAARSNSSAVRSSAGIPHIPLGLPKLSRDLWGTPEQVALGEKLFADRRLSFNNTLSCSMCHIAGQGFASNQTSRAIGIEGRTGRRNAPTVLNVAYQKLFFHDGRETDLSQQAWSPLLDHNEMGNPSIGSIIDRIKATPDYAGLFEHAFNGEGPSMHTVGTALASFQRTLLSGNSRFDRWYFGKDENALTENEKNGFAVFVGKGRCAQCHLIDSDSALFTDHLFHDTGIGYLETQALGATSWRVQLAPDTFVSVKEDVLRPVSEPWKNDVGRFEITLNPNDRWAFKTPGLRDVARTAPYMHDGSLFNLEEVIEHYDRGGIPHEGLSDKIAPLGLTEQEKADLVAYLKSLTGDGSYIESRGE